MPRLALALVLASGAAAADTTQLVVKGGADLTLSGGATVISEGFDTCLRSGSPHQTPVVEIVKPLASGVTVQSLSFAFEYTAGWSGAGGSNFSLVVGETVLYASSALGKYTYKKAAPGDYSPPIIAQATGLSIALPKSGVSRIELRFQNNDRNVQLRLPLTFNITCDGPCVAAPAPPPAPPWTPTALFVDGNRDQRDRTWACVAPDETVILLHSPLHHY